MILPTFRRPLKAQQFQHPYSVIDDLQMNLRIVFYFFAFHVFFSGSDTKDDRLTMRKNTMKKKGE